MLGKHPLHQQRCHLPGFSLVEILVCLSIMAVLLAIIIAATTSSKQKARQSVCLSNLKQLSGAMLMYASDYDECLPAEEVFPFYTDVINYNIKANPDWASSIKGYVKSDLTCPNADDVFGSKVPFSGYCYNSRLTEFSVPTTRPISQRGKQLSQIKKPTTTIMLFDGRSGLLTNSIPDANNVVIGTYNGIDMAVFWSLAPGAFRHQGGANYSFVDGHAKWFAPQALDRDDPNTSGNPGFGL